MKRDVVVPMQKVNIPIPKEVHRLFRAAKPKNKRNLSIKFLLTSQMMIDM
jgi:hypothetical protein